MKQPAFVLECARSLITIKANNCTYHGIKRLWSCEVDEAIKELPYNSHSIYKLVNSNYNLVEHWIVEKEEDLLTLKRYLKDYNREKDYKKREKIKVDQSKIL